MIYENLLEVWKSAGSTSEHCIFYVIDAVISSDCRIVALNGWMISE
jgi:hypothetical protein